ncbi:MULTISPECIES: LysR family transcriptional regulator [unclassified Achromobacter]|uniref:LysR family transcriptional regulator n=1 Tax=unclassified Achromobacter TaxID=2626865 RepID=UPI000B515661|nr:MULTISPECIES: LysR family transcriptional regulator [unclassified Achromobacter]OWT77157.1 LysR family transcriptional regulator [Achromobacter sp. HZ28]OWT78038.1 LysR family transcriptional regulator [Achromobacter sp. HZ34]
MLRKNLNDLVVFVTVAKEGSFTRAAAQLGVSQSALSHTVRDLESRLGVRLLTRTTRSLSMTEAGQRLFENVAPRLEDIEADLVAVGELRDRPAGIIRITTAEHAANSVLWPKLSPILSNYPEIQVEITIDYGLTDIVAQRYDAGVRLGDQVAKDMIAVRIGPDLRIAVVGTPGYLAANGRPRTPRDLAQHRCINLRLPTHGSLLVWDFAKGRQQLNVRVEGQWIFNNSSQIVQAALAGYGLAFVPEDLVAPHLSSGRLVRVLDDWCQPYAGYHLYYPSRRQSSRALGILVDALRHRPSK